MCQLFETIRVEQGVAHFVDYHQRRVDRSVERIGSKEGVDLRSYIEALELPATGCHKLRISYTGTGIVGHSVTLYQARRVESLRLVVADSICYDCKWEDRGEIERLVAQSGGCDDVLIVRRGAVTDCSFANVALFDGVEWVTPAVPLLGGTCRERLVEEGVLRPRVVTAESLGSYKAVALINAMIGFDPGRAIDMSAVAQINLSLL